ncbi:serine/threonine-protein kinase [Candidatus Uabimicrobium amorphum]|uniref:Protein kinase n=1 Tax=Uabimicrobium amorphum TaxID=2596890 RepID=A0A5S9F641_UABAM|nr:serine/threonine-protein kinase [Candidatus Uabimicrobium amorphum]BBM86259.1 protein kinase [Candidatus Uabimicrobium amorphum]
MEKQNLSVRIKYYTCKILVFFIIAEFIGFIMSNYTNQEKLKEQWAILTSQHFDQADITYKPHLKTFSDTKTITPNETTEQTFSDTKTITPNEITGQTFSDEKTIFKEKKQSTFSDIKTKNDLSQKQYNASINIRDSLGLPVVHHFREEKKIAEGGMGVVIHSQQQNLYRDVVVKKIKEGGNEERFIQESLLTGLLEHPHIAPVHELALNKQNEIILVMKNIQGYTWKELLSSNKQKIKHFIARNIGKKPCEIQEEDKVKYHLNILLKVCDAIAFAHEQKIIHNDLKPENIMVSDYGEVVVMDWGIATSIGEKNPFYLHKSMISGPMGTPCYISPELAKGDVQHIKETSDVYLLGAILHEIVTGKPPHQGASVWMVLLSAIEGKFSESVDSISLDLQELRDIYTKAMSKNSDERYQNVTEFKNAISEYFGHKESITLTKNAENLFVECNNKIIEQEKRHKDYGVFFFLLDKIQGIMRLRQKSNNIFLYEKLEKSVSGFRQALKLWPKNNAAREGEQKALFAYAKLASMNKEFHLANTQIKHLVKNKCEKVQSLQKDIQDLKKNKESYALIRRKLKYSIGLTCYILIVFFLPEIIEIIEIVTPILTRMPSELLSEEPLSEKLSLLVFLIILVYRWFNLLSVLHMISLTCVGLLLARLLYVTTGFTIPHDIMVLCFSIYMLLFWISNGRIQ